MSEPGEPATGERRPAPLEHVFVATDFSTGAGQAAARAALLPLASRGRISAVHVLPDRLPRKARASAEAAARRQLREVARALSTSAAALGRRDLRVSTELCQGPAYVEIVRHARAAGAELVVLGRHGQRPVRDRFIGSTAERVIRAGDLPVLVVSRRAGRSYRRPLIAVDLEDTCRSVIALAVRVFGPPVTAAAMVHAYHVPFEDFLALRREYRRTAAAGLARLQASLGELGVRWDTALVRGDPRLALLGEAIRRRADLLAVGTHGRSGLSHALLGSVAEWVIRAAACDVLVARPVRVSFQLP